MDDGTGCVEINHTEYKKFVTPHWLAQSEERRQSAKAAPQLPTAPLPPMNPSHIPLGNWSIGRFTIRVKRGGVVEFDKVERLRSVQEEVNHWKQVMRLHETHYRRPFIIPPLLPPPEEVPLPPLSQRDRISGEALPKPLSNPAPPPPPVNEHLQVCLMLYVMAWVRPSQTPPSLRSRPHHSCRIRHLLNLPIFTLGHLHFISHSL